MKPDHLVIVNPQARHGETERLLPVIERLLANSSHEIVSTRSPGDAVGLAAAASGCDVVVAAGGATGPCTRSSTG